MNERPNCMKRFWTFKKQRRSDGRKIPPLKTDGTLHSEQPEKADILNGPFQKLFQKKKTSISNEEFQKQCKMTGKFNTIKDINITENGVHKLLKNLNPNKTAGPDNITPRVIKELATYSTNINHNIPLLISNK
jgi:hypothetical protein